MPICSNCRLDLPPRARRCSACGTRPRGFRLILVLVWIFVALFAVAVWVGRMGDSDASQSESGNYTVVLETPCADSQFTEIEIVLALHRSDNDAVRGLLARENVALLEPGTRMRGVDSDHRLTQVRIQSGYYIDKYCWVPSSMLTTAANESAP